MKIEDKIRFVESVNQYYNLIVDQAKEFPCFGNTKLKKHVYVHEAVR